jgi:hypothetical protein
VLLLSQFQGFCRDLHGECIEQIVAAVDPHELRPLIRSEFSRARQLDKGNPNPGNIGADFTRLGIDLWPAVKLDDARNVGRQAKLERLANWRNAIAHQDFRDELQPSAVTLRTLKAWRAACNALAFSFDRVVTQHLAKLLGARPW